MAILDFKTWNQDDVSKSKSCAAGYSGNPSSQVGRRGKCEVLWYLRICFKNQTNQIRRREYTFYFHERVHVSRRILYNKCFGEGCVRYACGELSEATCPGEGPPLQPYECNRLKSPRQVLVFNILGAFEWQWGNEGLQQLPFLLNTRRSRHSFSGKHPESVFLYVLLQGKKREEARKKEQGWSCSFFTSGALTKMVHSPITVITSQRRKCLSPLLQGWVWISGIWKIGIQPGSFPKTVFKPFFYGKKRQLRDGWEDLFSFLFLTIWKSRKEWERPSDRYLFLCPLTLYSKGINWISFRNLIVYYCDQDMK